MKIFSFLFFLIIPLLFSCSANKKVWVPSWKETSSMTVVRAGAAFVANKKYVYAIAGVDGHKFLKSIERAKILRDGHLGAWKIVSELPEARGFFSALIYKDRLYVVGGGNGPYGENLLNTVVSAAIGSSGELGKWRTEKNSMLTPRRCAKIFVSHNTLYAVGGFGGAMLDTVEHSEFAKDGQLSPWQMNDQRLNIPRYVNSVKKIGHNVFVVGGHSETSGRGIASVEFTGLDQSPFKWQYASALKQGRYAFASAKLGDTLYIMGGLSGTEYLNSIEYNDAASITQGKHWKAGIKLPENMANFSALHIGDRIYLFGGSTRYAYLNKVWFAESRHGKLGYWGSASDLSKLKKLVNKVALPNQGIVLERINAAGYTYMKVKKQNDKTIWLAAPINDIPVNAQVNFSEGIYMSNFYSKTLHRTFVAVQFVGTIQQIK